MSESQEVEKKEKWCLGIEHHWKETYYGYQCEFCEAFVPFGSEPWLRAGDVSLLEEIQEENEGIISSTSGISTGFRPARNECRAFCFA